MSAAPHLVISAVSKRFGAATVLDRVDLTIHRGELVTLLGPSGCGKTTLLRAIAGLAPPDAGTIALAGRDVTHVPPHRRNVGVVFQSYALFPHLTVAGNVAFGLKVRGAPKAEIDRAVARALSLVKLGHLGGRRISALSGGQQQRVALARAIAVEPDVLLFDEALSALDRKLREEMQVELRRLLQDVKATAIFVTHDQDEALTMSDRVAVMNKGRIEQLAEPRELYARPASLFALNFVGLSTRIAGQVVGVNGGTVEVVTPVGRLSARGVFQPGASVIVATRPEQLRLGAADGGNSAAGRVRSVVFQGSRTLVDVDAGAGASLLAELSGREAAVPEVHDEVRFAWPVSETFAFAAEASI
ncbi:ABC transporter ATP-binding protein [Bradyrhizobium ontarionense]|uniref:ABC transporter ATP-binding protein n=1 Tax=Bradyrhizobium ontarionense TaxID=2898149 RepID=A0ABY3R4M4_9BRAD|nr:ABC transporter ATP-binding protein [Bradyrhizobium sp. A19]UFZ01875.1 ABC transporter ATP-binding protein [Bradyrhizobium sp. A19]